MESNKTNVHNLDIRFDEKQNIWKKIKKKSLALKETKKFFLINPLSKISKLVIKKLYGENSNKNQIFFIDLTLKIAILSLIRLWLVDQKKLKDSEISKKLLDWELNFENENDLNMLIDSSIDILFRITLLSYDFPIKEMPNYIRNLNIWFFMIFKVLFSDSFSYFVEKREEIKLEDERKETIWINLAKNMAILITLHFISTWLFRQDLNIGKKIIFVLTLDSLLSNYIRFTGIFLKNNLKKKKVF